MWTNNHSVKTSSFSLAIPQAPEIGCEQNRPNLVFTELRHVPHQRRQLGPLRDRETPGTHGLGNGRLWVLSSQHFLFVFFCIQTLAFAVAVTVPLPQLFHDLFMCWLTKEGEMTTISRHLQKEGGGKTLPYLRHGQVVRYVSA